MTLPSISLWQASTKLFQINFFGPGLIQVLQVSRFYSWSSFRTKVSESYFFIFAIFWHNFLHFSSSPKQIDHNSSKTSRTARSFPRHDRVAPPSAHSKFQPSPSSDSSKSWQISALRLTWYGSKTVAAKPATSNSESVWNGRTHSRIRHNRNH